jgi:hypothetical protein
LEPWGNPAKIVDLPIQCAEEIDAGGVPGPDAVQRTISELRFRKNDLENTRGRR